VFQNWADYQLKPVAALFRWQMYPANQVIVNEGAPIKNFMFIRKGTCKLFQKYTSPTGEVFDVKIKTLKEYNYYGEDGRYLLTLAVLQEQVLGTVINSRFTLKTGNTDVQCGLISCYDARYVETNQESSSWTN
jgi:CRP-like cAMP-binding protein